MKQIRALLRSIGRRIMPAARREPTDFGDTYEFALRELRRAELARTLEIRRKAEAHEARARAYQRRGGTLGMGRGGVAL